MFANLGFSGRGDEENVRSILQKVHADLNALSDKVKEKVASGQYQVSGDDFASKLLERYNSL